jgi:hypothetical protein
VRAPMKMAHANACCGECVINDSSLLTRAAFRPVLLPQQLPRHVQA